MKIIYADGVKVTLHRLKHLKPAEIMHAVNYVRANIKPYEKLTELDIKLCPTGGYDLIWTAHGEKFERIRRITGYLTGNLDTWNDAKRAEESERVKHL